MTIPTYSQSIITAVKRVNQTHTFPSFIMGGRNAGTYKLFKKSTTYVFNLFRGPVRQIGRNFDIEQITIPVFPDLAADMSIIPVIYFDNKSKHSIGKTINLTNFPSPNNRLIKLTQKHFTDSVTGQNNAVRGSQNYFLELQVFGPALVVPTLPISIDVDIIDL